MFKVHLICVGKLRDSHLKVIEQDYIKRLTLLEFNIHETKAHGGQKELEAKEVLKKYHDINKSGKSHICLLAETGKKYDSPGLARWLFEELDSSSTMVFIIGGAEGHGQEILNLANSKLSLSPLTFPHQLARIILVEQLYRAQTIYQGHPYHK